MRKKRKYSLMDTMNPNFNIRLAKQVSEEASALFEQWKEQWREENKAATIEDIVTNAIADLQRNPVVVKHEIRRNIPRPVRATFRLTRGTDGIIFHLGTVDMSFKDTIPVFIRVNWMTGRDEDIAMPDVAITMHLEYDPREK